MSGRSPTKLEKLATVRLKIIQETLEDLEELHRELAAHGRTPVEEQRLRNIMQRLRGEDASDQP